MVLSGAVEIRSSERLRGTRECVRHIQKRADVVDGGDDDAARDV